MKHIFKVTIPQQEPSLPQTHLNFGVSFTNTSPLWNGLHQVRYSKEKLRVVRSYWRL